MLSEEASEFFMADSLVDRLDAWADFAFVAVGTACKYMASREKHFCDLRENHEKYTELATYIADVQNQMTTMLEEEIQQIRPEMMQYTKSGQTPLDALLSCVLLLVVEANEQKGMELNTAGKVVKPEVFVRPEMKIDVLLRNTLGAAYKPTYS